MEQGQCWMKTKRKYSLSSNLITSPTNNPSYDDSSWEEQAFAEDAAAGSLGGCIWPPRSYSCTFCRREFRSAQALGGHMNVHRRDRARLKQPSSPQSEILCQNNPFTSLGYLNPSPVCGLVYNTNPNSDVDVLVSPSSPSPPNKALAPSVNDTCREKILIPLYNSSILHKTFQGFKLRTASPDVATTSLPPQPHQTVKLILDGDHRLYSCKFHPEGNNIEKASKGLDLNLVVCRAHSPVQFETKEPDISCKKMKTEASSIQLFPKSSSVDRHHMQSKMFEFSPSSIEEVDLELRLGNNRSKV